MSFQLTKATKTATSEVNFLVPTFMKTAESHLKPEKIAFADNKNLMNNRW